MPRTVYSIVAFIWNVQNRQIHRAESRLVAARGEKGEDWRVTASGDGVLAEGDEKVLE